MYHDLLDVVGSEQAEYDIQQHVPQNNGSPLLVVAMGTVQLSSTVLYFIFVGGVLLVKGDVILARLAAGRKRGR